MLASGLATVEKRFESWHLQRLRAMEANLYFWIQVRTKLRSAIIKVNAVFYLKFAYLNFVQP
jgi:hypothetical protein